MSTSSDAIPAPPPPRRLRLIDYLGVFFGITTVVSLALAYYWHAQSVQERAPTYYIGPARARIVDTSVPAPPQLQVLYRGKDLNANVSAAIVYFWNDGRLPIKAEDVLEPLRIQLAPGCEIIDARILRISRAVTRFAKGEISETAKNALPLSFSILERNDGAVLQIIYTGNPEARVSVAGTIVGPGSPREVLSQEPKPIAQSYLSKLLLASAVFITLIAISAVLLMNPLRRRLGRRPLRAREFMPMFAMLGINVILLCALAYDVHRRSQPVVPQTLWIGQ
jgi:hypothetical protein